jgi:hypothetical protein
MFAGEYVATAHAAGNFTLACPTLVNPYPIDWSAAIVAKDDRTVSIYFVGGTLCTGLLQRVEVAETQTTVTVIPYLGVARPLPSLPGISCDAYGLSFATVVKLAEALGNRQLKTRRPAGDGRPFVSHL